MCALAWQPSQMCYSHHFSRACQLRRREACARCLVCAYRVALSAPKAKRVIVRDYMGSKPTLGRVALREAASASPPDTKRAMLAQSFDARAQFATQHRRRCERATCAVVARGWATSSQVGRLRRWRRGIPTHTHSWWSEQRCGGRSISAIVINRSAIFRNHTYGVAGWRVDLAKRRCATSFAL